MEETARKALSLQGAEARTETLLVTAEGVWLELLRGAKPWSNPARRIVVLSPHPDDEILGAGGYLAAQVIRGVEIIVIAASDGEAAYPDFPDLGRIRQQEQNSALKRIGIEPSGIRRLALADGKLTLHEDHIARYLLTVLDADSLLLAPWEHDHHPDHEACGRAAKKACQATGASHASYFFWAWHHSSPQAVAQLNPLRFELNGVIQELKQAALREYRSQLHRVDGEPILPDALLVPALRSFEAFAVHAE